MVEIQDTTIKMTRGDTLETTVTIKTKAWDVFIPSPGDKIRFVAGRKYIYPPIIRKDIPIDTLALRLESAETKRFAPRDKPYKYYVKVMYGTGGVDTFIAGDLFILPGGE